MTFIWWTHSLPIFDLSFIWWIEWYLYINHDVKFVVPFTKYIVFCCFLLIWYVEIVFFVEYTAWYVRAEIEWLHLIFIWGKHSWLIKTERHFCNNYEKKNHIVFLFTKEIVLCLFLLIWYVRAKMEWLHLIFISGTTSWLIKTERHFCNNYEINYIVFLFTKGIVLYLFLLIWYVGAKIEWLLIKSPPPS